jgi:hypothetical protein
MKLTVVPEGTTSQRPRTVPPPGRSVTTPPSVPPPIPGTGSKPNTRAGVYEPGARVAVSPRPSCEVHGPSPSTPPRPSRAPRTRSRPPIAHLMGIRQVAHHGRGRATDRIVAPSPSCPPTLAPQHTALHRAGWRSSRRPPAVIASATSAEARHGPRRSGDRWWRPSPSCPRAPLLPQHDHPAALRAARTVCSDARGHGHVASARPITDTGVAAVALHGRAVAELPAAVVAPAQHRAVGPHRARVARAGRRPTRDVLDAKHRSRWLVTLAVGCVASPSWPRALF